MEPVEPLEVEMTREQLRGLLLIAATYARSTVQSGEIYVDAAPALALLLELAAEEML